jgi:hypothetical protein
MNPLAVFEIDYLAMKTLPIAPLLPVLPQMLWHNRLREAGAGGSNPLTPTNRNKGLAKISLGPFSFAPPNPHKMLIEMVFRIEKI